MKFLIRSCLKYEQQCQKGFFKGVFHSTTLEKSQVDFAHEQSYKQVFPIERQEHNTSNLSISLPLPQRARLVLLHTNRTSYL